MRRQIQKIHEHLFSTQETKVYAILDGASTPNLLENLEETNTEYVCLYRGELDPELAQTAPYLVVLAPNTVLTNWVLRGFGGHCGIFAVSKSDLREMRKHFRKFLMIYDPAGKPVYFRYYDPRVFRNYLPTCSHEETRAMFGPVSTYFAEAEEENNLIRFDADGDRAIATNIRIDVQSR